MATAQERYIALQRPREAVLRQAREAAKLTIPGLIPDVGGDPHDIAVQPYSSLGARGVNNVASKLLLSLFPPERPFFRLDIDPDTADAMGADLGKAQAALSGVSYRAMILAESSGSRPLWMEVFRHLIIAGNALVYHPDDGTTMRLWRLDQYAVRRDAQGHMIEVIIEEEVYPSELGEEVLRACQLDKEANDLKGDETGDSAQVRSKDEQKVKIYTVVVSDGEAVEHWQELNKVEVPKSRGKAKAAEAGWQALRWQAVPGSDYGRSFVSEYAGDFMSLEDATKAILQFAAEAARIVRVVDPNSAIDIEELAAAETGDHVTGYVDKVQTLEVGKSHDFSAVLNVVQMIERRLSQAFLLTANTIRDAERVTAEEIRAVAQELEDAFGGTYTILSDEAQTPYARRLLYILGKQKKGPKASDLLKKVTPMVVTGFSALGQNHEVAAIWQWLNGLKSVFGDQWLATNLNGQEVALRTGVGAGITSVDRFLVDPEQIQDAQNADQLNATAAEAGVRAAPEIVKSAVAAAHGGANQQEPNG